MGVVVGGVGWRSDLVAAIRTYIPHTPLAELYKGRHHVVNSTRNELEVLEDINKVLYEVSPSLLRSG